MYSKIIATGSFIPSDVLTNADLEQRVDTTNEWIVARTGIESRTIMSDDMTVADMATEAAKNAIASIKVERPDFDEQEIDLIIVATTTSESMFPSSACQVQGNLGINDSISFDLAAACSGFVYALATANNFIKAGNIRKALVIGADCLSKTCDPEDRSTIILFGDAAGCFLLEASEEAGILSTHLHANNTNAEILKLPNRHFNPNGHLDMTGNAVFKVAVTELANIVDETLAANNITKDDIDWLVPHQANIRIINATAKKLGLPTDRVILTVQKHGNTSSASVPTAFDEGVKQNKFKKGDLILIEAFGGGMTWGSALIKY